MSVDFGQARRAAARGLARAGSWVAESARAGASAFNSSVEAFDKPGSKIEVQPFGPGTVTTGAFLAKLATKVYARVRDDANARRDQENQAVKNAYMGAQTANLQAKAAGTGPSALETARTGLITQQTATSAAQERAALARAGYLEHKTANPTAPKAPKRAPAANAVLRSIDDELSENGPVARDAYQKATAYVNRLMADMQSKDASKRSLAARALGVKDYRWNDQTYQTEAVVQNATKEWVNRFVLRALNARRAQLEGRRKAAIGVLDSEAFGEEDLEDPDAADAEAMLDEEF